jgi:hypothetical protein
LYHLCVLQLSPTYCIIPVSYNCCLHIFLSLCPTFKSYTLYHLCVLQMSPTYRFICVYSCHLHTVSCVLQLSPTYCIISVSTFVTYILYHLCPPIITYILYHLCVYNCHLHTVSSVSSNYYLHTVSSLCLKLSPTYCIVSQPDIYLLLILSSLCLPIFTILYTLKSLPCSYKATIFFLVVEAAIYGYITDPDTRCVVFQFFIFSEYSRKLNDYALKISHAGSFL